MAIYKYTLMKYLKSYSTWVITGISIFMVVVLGGYLPFHYFKPEKDNAEITYGVISIALVAGITSFLAIFTSVFAGFKSASMYKDEVEDGTFLVMLSKPITRSRIIFFKWLALQSIIIIYTLIVALSFALALAAFDKGHQVPGLSRLGITTLRSKIFQISLALWGILFVVSLIFSSIALLLSTRLSVGTTIGISIALGVVVPITSLVGTFTVKPEYKSVTNANASSTQSFAQLAGASGLPSLTDEANTLYAIGASTGDKDAFKFAQVFDLNYQVTTLSQFASDQIIPDGAKEQLSSSKVGERQMSVSKTTISDANTITGTPDARMKQVNNLIVKSWQATEPYRLMMINLVESIIMNNKIEDSAMINFAMDKKVIIINEQTKAQFMSKNPSQGHDEFDWCWAAAKKPYAQWQQEFDAIKNDPSKDDATKKADALKLSIDYYYTNVFVFNIANSIAINHKITFPHLTIPGIADEHSKASALATTLGEKLAFISRPLDFWVDTRILTEVRESNSIDKDLVKGDLVDDLGVLSYTTTALDVLNYSELKALVDHGVNVVKIKHVDYASKYTVLWVYLALALGLVPLSYFAVRRQDFR